MTTNRFDAHGAMIRLHVPATPPCEAGLPGNANAGVAAAKADTWGDRLLGHRHQQVRVEPATQTRHLGYDSRLIDGELYTADCRRGNIRATVIRGGTPSHPLGSMYRLHPFANGAVRNQLPVRVYLPKQRVIGEHDAPATLATTPIPEQVSVA